MTEGDVTSKPTLEERVMILELAVSNLTAFVKGMYQDKQREALYEKVPGAKK